VIFAFRLNSHADTPESCTLISDPTSRLACYDAIFLMPSINNEIEDIAEVRSRINTAPQEAKTNAVDTAQSPTSSSVPSAVVSNVVATLEQSVQRTASSDTIETAKALNQAVDIASVSSQDELFGAEQIKNKAIDMLDEVVFTVSEISENRNKVRTITFSNAQVWREVTSTRLRIKKGDTVTIKKGALSSYYLKKDGLNRKTQVRRVR
jgi:hypothetical protein